MQHSRWHAIHFRLGMRHVTAVLVFVPVEWQSVDFVVLPAVNGTKGRLSPVIAFVSSEIGGAVYEHDEAFIPRIYETFLYPVPDELAEGVVIR